MAGAFFVAAFEREEFVAEEISATWLIPETVILLGATLFGDLSGTIVAPRRERSRVSRGSAEFRG
jgi:hypothetical protein